MTLVFFSLAFFFAAPFLLGLLFRVMVWYGGWALDMIRWVNPTKNSTGDLSE
jgi:high-affinity Fe2+/Pb2+ permease